ncbi:MAG: class I SAM-dependent methyltransferase [Terracidiphilus sp.]|jgi:SAM-dependent methyltransferase
MDEQLPEIDSDIAEYYRQAPEERRLEEGAFLLESLRTRELIERHAPASPATVVDIGGAAGAYALWLAEAGYSVHLLDPIPRLVAEAERRSVVAPRPLASCAVGDARNLPFPDKMADLVLLLGPLYHLTAAQDRAGALDEAARVLKPGGCLFAAAVCRWASALDGLARDLFEDPQFTAIVGQDLRDGQHRNLSGHLDYFTTAYFHRPEDLRAEVLDAGFEMVGLFGIEGPGWILPDVGERLADGRRREDLLRVARWLESEPTMLAASAHLLAVARKPA